MLYCMLELCHVLYQKVLEGLIVGDDAIVDDNKLVFVVRYLRTACEDGWLMCGPTYVCNASMTVEVGVRERESSSSRPNAPYM